MPALASASRVSIRNERGGDGELQRIRRDVYQTLRHLRARSDEDISPRWQGLQLAVRAARPLVPNWLAGGFALAALVAAFFFLRFSLSTETGANAATLLALHPATPVTIQRPTVTSFEPFKDQLFDPKTTQIERISASLAPEIAAGTIGVEPVGDKVIVRLDNLILFESGKVETRPEFAAVAARLAAMLESETGQIFVTGHSDNVRLKASSRFASNFDLSVKRAEAVASLIEAGVSDRTRFVVTGKGDAEPLAKNDTAEGRKQNRRVEIMIAREADSAVAAAGAAK